MEEEKGETCSTYRTDEHIQNISRKPEGKRPTGRLGVDERTILKQILKK
jgi:hypothetical protein